MQCQPVVAHGVLYASSPKLRVFALDAATGAPRWSFDPFEGTKTSRWTRIRGLMYRERGDERRIYFGARHWLYALDATTGKPIASFGENGRVDLRLGFEGREPGSVSIRVNTPGVFYEDLLILGSVVPEGLPSAPGDIRAFDVHTGRQRWSFHTIPHPGEPGYDTWPKDAWKYVGGANAWAGLSLDVEARPRLRRDRLGVLRLLRREPTRRQPVRELDPVPEGRDRRARLALPGREARRLGPRLPRRPGPDHDHEGRQAPRRRGADREERPHLRSRPRDRRARLPDGGAAREAVRRAGRAARDHAAPADPATALHATEVHRGSGHRRARRPPARRCWRNGARSARPASTIRRACRARSSSPAWTAAASGAGSPSTRPRACST